jgi:hypothetical protein
MAVTVERVANAVGRAFEVLASVRETQEEGKDTWVSTVAIVAALETYVVDVPSGPDGETELETIREDPLVCGAAMRRLDALVGVVETFDGQGEGGAGYRIKPDLSVEQAREMLAWTLPAAPGDEAERTETSPEATGVDLDLLRELVEITAERKAIAAEERKLKERKDRLDETIGDMFANAGVQKVGVDKFLVSASEFHYPEFPAGKEKAAEALCETDWTDVASAVARQDLWAVVDALRGEGYGQLVKFDVNATSLGKLVRDRLKEHGELPPEFEGLIEAGSKWRIGVTKDREA